MQNGKHLKNPKIREPMPTSLKRDCITNFDMLFLVMGFISLVDEIEFMLISSRHICIRSICLN